MPFFVFQLHLFVFMAQILTANIMLQRGLSVFGRVSCSRMSHKLSENMAIYLSEKSLL